MIICEQVRILKASRKDLDFTYKRKSPKASPCISPKLCRPILIYFGIENFIKEKLNSTHFPSQILYSSCSSELRKSFVDSTLWSIAEHDRFVLEVFPHSLRKGTNERRCLSQCSSFRKEMDEKAQKGRKTIAYTSHTMKRGKMSQKKVD